MSAGQPAKSGNVNAQEYQVLTEAKITSLFFTRLC